MANVFGILTAIVLAIAIFVGLKNKSAFEREIESTSTAQSELAAIQTKEDKAQADLATAQKDTDEVKAQIPDALARGEAQKKVNTELEASKTAKTQQVETNKATLDQVREKTGTLENIKELATKMFEMSNQSKDLDATLAASESKLASLTSENNRLDAQVGEQRRLADLRSKGESFPTLETRISAIYPNWGFVTLAAGNSSGVIMNSPLSVVRDGEVIAELLVTAVERNTASASIVPESVKADTVISVGDTVVPGTKAPSSNSASQPAAPAPRN